MTTSDLVAFLRRNRWAVQSSVSASGEPQAAVVGFAVTDRLELLFDTLVTTRKCRNLRRDPRLAFVVGWDEDQTVQYEGVADEPTGPELVALQEVYFGRFPDGRARQSWPGITYVRTRPTWIRYSDYRGGEPTIVEFRGDDLPR